jgi:putative ABC transport system ATP-binding protein
VISTLSACGQGVRVGDWGIGGGGSCLDFATGTGSAAGASLARPTWCGCPHLFGRWARWTVVVCERRLNGVDTVVRLEGVSRTYQCGDRAVVALDDVSMAITPATFVAVMGATGSGKSTLLHCAAGLERPSAGAVWLVGRELRRMSERAITRLRRNHVGFVFQSYNLLSELTVEQNVLLPHRLGGPLATSVAEVLDAVGLAGNERRSVGELSGGERQRVAVARALAIGPEVIFADEPTGALDPSTGGRILALLRSAVNRRRVTVVMVTHDPLAAAVGDRLVLLRAGQVVDDRPTPDAPTIARLLRTVSPPSASGLVA